MDYTKSNLLSIDLNKIYEAELHALVRQNEALRIHNETLKQQQLGQKNMESKKLGDEFKQMSFYEKGDASTNLGISVTALCKGLDLVKKKHLDEMEKLSTELLKTEQELGNLAIELQREKALRMQAEAEKQEAIEIAEELLKQTEQQTTERRPAVLPTLHVPPMKPAHPASTPQGFSERQKTLKTEKNLLDTSEARRQHLLTKALRTVGSLHGQVMELEQLLQKEKEPEASRKLLFHQHNS